MKKSKSKLLIFLALLFLLSTTTQGATFEYFPDVPATADYAEAVKFIAEIGVIKGDEFGNFNPDQTITRAEFATMMCRLIEVEDEALAITKSSFDDVPSSHWACGYVTKAVELGFVSGYGDGRFGPSDTLTYEQAVTVLIRMLGLADEANNQGGYPDGYISVARIGGLTNNTTVDIGKAIKRSTVAILMYNIF